tara:strand:- start:159 stop:464 length:306 start_codon:yes stop_codon:yes gene_type:complete
MNYFGAALFGMAEDFGEAGVGRWSKFYNDSHYYTKWTTKMLPKGTPGRVMFTIQQNGEYPRSQQPFELFMWSAQTDDIFLRSYGDLTVAKAAARAKYDDLL